MKLTEELQQKHEYQQQLLRSELTEENERKVSSMKRKLDELNENEECQFMDSLNVSKFNMTDDVRRKEQHEVEIKKLKENHEQELKKLKKSLDDELQKLKQNLQNEVCLGTFWNFLELLTLSQFHN